MEKMLRERNKLTITATKLQKVFRKDLTIYFHQVRKSEQPRK